MFQRVHSDCGMENGLQERPWWKTPIRLRVVQREMGEGEEI